MKHLPQRLFSPAILLGAAAMILATALSSCSKPKPPVIADWESYQDPFYGFELQYPKGWLVNAEANRIKIYSSQEAATYFFDPSSGGKNGVEVLFGFENFAASGVSTLDAYDAQTKDKLSGIGTIDSDQPGTLGKENGHLISYTSNIAKGVTIYGRRTIVVRDSVFYYVNFSGFNDDYQLYGAVFDTILASIKLPKPKVAVNKVDEDKPSTELSKYSGDFFQIQYPDNFEYSFPPKKGETMFSMNIHHKLRQDCAVQIDILPAKKLDVEKVFKQNKDIFKPKSTGDTKIDGLAAKFLSYAPEPKVGGKAYFVVKDDKVYRLVITWFQPMSADYVPAFDKVVESFKIK
ncbi:MAG TPA: PsbP-related protein [Bacteroidota bacterium]|nr:PsbP-related protein [Bacteroidota bacterium]